MEDEQPFNDIMDAVYRLRHAFLKHGMKPPISLELGHVQDGSRFRYMMPRDMVMVQPRMGDGPQDAEWVCNIMGVEIRMPGQWRMDTGGRSHFV